MDSDVAIPQTNAETQRGRDSTSSHDLRMIFKQRVAVMCLTLIVIHQTIIAGSTFFLTNTISKFQSNQGYFADLCLYLAAMAIPYLPGCASFVALQRWINRSHEALVEKFASTVATRRPNYRDHATRENVTAVLARNSFPVLKDYISFIHDLASFSLNSFLSIAVIVLLLPAELASGYCLSLALCFIIVIGFRKTISQASSRCEYAYLRYSGLLCSFWPNVALGNKHNESIWRAQREAAGRAFYSNSNRLEALRQSGNVLLAAASLGPTIFLIVAIARDATVAPSIIAALIVSLTRIFLIVNSLSTLVHRVLDYSSLHARLKVVFDAKSDLENQPRETIAGSIDILINKTRIRDLSEGKRVLASSGCGRFTVTGGNGSGKSTFLLALKQEYGEACFLLPADHFDLTWTRNCQTLSTGQRLAEHLIEIFEIEAIQYILLDEWDANLDMDNIKKIEQILHSLSTTKVIVEARHSRSQT